MPPKGQQQEKKKPKLTGAAVVAERTFGMKNKKGAQAQKNIQQMTHSASVGGTPAEKKAMADKQAREREKLAAEKMKKEEAELFKPLQVQKVAFGVDPKTVLCQFFKKGHCEKGRKCKFSHDPAVERKTEKKDLYQDSREEEEEKKKKETNEDWDLEKLSSVVLSKKGNQKTTTDKVCKFFIDAVEDGKYGWFWTCPNGGDKCMYQHKLPPGFVLKTKEQRAAEKALMDKSPLKTLTLEDFLETERQKLTGTLTPVTPESFAKWKAERLDKKAAEEQAKLAQEATGRAMFEKGDWKVDVDEESDNDDGDAWDMEKLRLETEALRQKKEAQRLGLALPANRDGSVNGDDENDNDNDDVGSTNDDAGDEDEEAAKDDAGPS